MPNAKHVNRKKPKTLGFFFPWFFRELFSLPHYGQSEPLEVQRPLKGWVFTKDHYFSRDLQSTIPRDYYFNGL